MAVVGIDLGTTRSSIAYISSTGQPTLLFNAESEVLTPSVILINEEDGKMRSVVGKAAKMSLVAKPDDIVRAVKSHMYEPDYFFEDSRGKKWKPETLSTLILKKLKKDAEVRLKEKITHAVITVPYYFKDLEKRRTIQAGEIAGLNLFINDKEKNGDETCYGILDEPVAAVYAYALKEGLVPMTYCVYDYGGGTFDVSIVEVTGDQKIKIKSTAGYANLGGENIDAQIVSYFYEKFEEEHKIKLSSDQRVHYDFLEKAERAKEILSDQKETFISLSAEGKNMSLTLTRAELEKLTTPQIELTIITLEEALLYYTAKIESEKLKVLDEKEREIKRLEIVKELKEMSSTEKDKWTKIKKEQWNKIDKILLVGGSSKIPMVAEEIRKETGIDPVISDADQIVAKGAAIQAAWLAMKFNIPVVEPMKEDGTPLKIKKKSGSITLPTTRIVNHSLGVKARNITKNKFINSIIIHKGADIPEEGREGKEIYYTESDDQTAVEIILLQGEAEDPKFCVSVGSEEGYFLDGIPPRPAGEIKIIVKMKIDMHNIIHVHAFALETEKELDEIMDTDLKDAKKLEIKANVKWLKKEQIEKQKELVKGM